MSPNHSTPWNDRIYRDYEEDMEMIAMDEAERYAAEAEWNADAEYEAMMFAAQTDMDAAYAEQVAQYEEWYGDEY